MYWLEKKYISFVGSSLRNFKWKSAKVANFSCPFCGDSQNDKTKARGYMTASINKRTMQDAFAYYCHNCNETMGVDQFLQRINEPLYQEFKLECLKEKNSSQPQRATKPKPKFDNTRIPRVVKSDTGLLVPVESLPQNHAVLEYLKARGIHKFDRLYWTNTFGDTVKDLHPECKLKLKNEPRLCLLLRSKQGNPFGIIGRSIDAQTDPKYRYLTIKFDSDMPKLFGLEKLDKEKPTIVVEGPIDSLLVPNAIAMCGGSFSLDELDAYVDRDKTFVALDNEPRKPETVNKMLKFANNGYRVVVWKGVDSAYKDINDMLLKGSMTPRDVLSEIVTHSYSGLSAINEIVSWKKCAASALLKK